MKLKLIFLFVIVLLGLNYSFSSSLSLGRGDYVLSEDLDPRSPILGSFTALSVEETAKGAPVNKEVGGKKTRAKGFIRRADSPSSSESEEEEQKSASDRKKGSLGTDSALDSSDGGTPPSTRRGKPKLSLSGLTDDARQAFWKLMNRIAKEGGSAEKQLDRLRQEVASATSL